MDKTQKSKPQKTQTGANVLETVKDIGRSTVNSVQKDLLGASSEDFFRQLLGTKAEPKHGEIRPGESFEMDSVLAGRQEEITKQRRKSELEKSLLREEKERVEKKSAELRLQLHAITREIIELAKTTQGLAEEVEVASMQAPASPGVYHVVFFEKLLEFVRSFRMKIQNSRIWLNASNKRAEKKNYWAMYKKKGSSFLLAPDHYLQRSAG